MISCSAKHLDWKDAKMNTGVGINYFLHERAATVTRVTRGSVFGAQSHDFQELC